MRNIRMMAAIAAFVASACSIVLAAPHDDTAAITAVTEAFATGWDKADAQAISTYFTKDATLVIPEGQMFEGRTAIEGFYRAAFDHGYKGSHAGSKIEHITYPTADLAFVDGEWRIDGAHQANGSMRSPERGIFFAVVLRRNGRWVIAALREYAGAKAVRASR